MRILLVAALLFAAPATAQTAPPAPAPATATKPGTIETARELMVVMRLPESYDDVFKSVIELTVESITSALQKDAKLPQSVRDDLETDDGRARVGRIVAQEMLSAFRARYGELAELTAGEYAKVFAEDELRTLIAFYSTGAGAKSITMMAKLSARIEELSGKIGEKAGAEAYERIRDRLDRRRGT